MQVKFLSIALTTALAAALTGCGGDNDNNYNKDQYVPIPGGASSAQIDALQKQIEALKNSSATDKSKLNALQEKLNQICSANPKACGSTSGNASGGTSGNTSGGTSGNTSGGTSGSTSGGTSGNTSGGTSGNTSPAQPVAPVVDPENNAGNAANTNELSKKDLVVVQNYVRGTNTAFDTDINPDVKNDGNATVVGLNKLDNPVHSNIVVASTVINGKNKQAYVGEAPEDVFDYNYNNDGQLDLNNPNTLQNNNVTTVEYNSNITTAYSTIKGQQANVSTLSYSKYGELAQRKDLSGKAISLLREEGAIRDLSTDPNAELPVAAKPFLLERGYNPVNKSLTLSFVANGGGVNNNSTVNNLKQENPGMRAISKAAYESGLVRTFSVGKSEQDSEELLDQTFTTTSGQPRFVIRGQEDQTIKVKGGKVQVIHRTGAEVNDDNNTIRNGILGDNTLIKENNVRIFGSLSKSVNNNNGVSVGDIPLMKWDDAQGKLVKNEAYGEAKKVFSLSEGTPNSYQLTAERVNKDKSLINSLTTNNGTYFNGSTPEARNERKNELLRAASFNAKPIHLDHVQYGRVSFQADDKEVKRVIDEFATKDLTNFTLAEKFTYKNDAVKSSQDKKNTIVNQYFARGLEPTPNMPKKEGNVTYLGHALTYGLDNSYHKDDTLDSNSLATKKREGIGNFVRANVNFAEGKVNGSIYNVWLPNSDTPNVDVEEDNLVTFEGNITPEHNSVIGTSQLAYGTKEKGSFKGAFYGKGAAELGGSVNSVTEGYGPAKWGGVFGAKKEATSTKPSINNGVEVIN